MPFDVDPQEAEEDSTHGVNKFEQIKHQAARKLQEEQLKKDRPTFLNAIADVEDASDDDSGDDIFAVSNGDIKGAYSRGKSHGAVHELSDHPMVIQNSCWASLPQELLRDVIKRLEASESTGRSMRDASFAGS
ncbi:hypothetical protein Acr_21g0001280 [Actinidia rufa]|uniref:Uncharacterized protein n=1 Tax=Actinidia rufa TaxID=165716 RepID=A0A7J0GFF6_9ERIC|nr:hypothetical protein Acr_21g0001280 [Actinidia rufa]